MRRTPSQTYAKKPQRPLVLPNRITLYALALPLQSQVVPLNGVDQAEKIGGSRGSCMVT